MQEKKEQIKRVVTVSGLLQCLEEGMTREMIAEHYGISLREVKKHFTHPKLKGKQAKKPMETILIDDTEDAESIANNTLDCRPYIPNNNKDVEEEQEANIFNNL